MERKIISTEVVKEEARLEQSLRPRLLKDYIGQTKLKSILKIYIEAARGRGESLDHVLFYGPPGLGKTTLSGIIAAEMGVNMKVTSGPAIEKRRGRDFCPHRSEIALVWCRDLSFIRRPSLRRSYDALRQCSVWR